MKKCKILAFLMAMALIMSMFAGCGSSASSAASSAASEETAASEAEEATSAEEEAGEEESTATTSSGEHKPIAEVAPDVEIELPFTTEDITFTYFTTLNPQITGYMSDLSENLYYQTAAELTGISIEFVLASPDTQSENFQLMIASGEYTDIIGSEGANYTGGVENAIEDEVYVNILDYAEYAPNYFELVNRDEYDYSVLLTDSGYMAGFGIVYTEDQPLNQGWMVRQDWLDDLGLDTPVTYDDWYEMLCAFRDAYDCVPLAMTGMTLGSLAEGYGVYGEVDSSTPPVYVDNGTVKFGWVEDGYKEYIQMLADWYADGLIDDDELINSDPFPDETAIITDKRGAWKVERDNMVYYQGLASDSDFRAVAVQYPSMNEGETTHFMELTTNIAEPALFLTTTCENIELLVQWVDFRYSEQGATLANYGTEGYTFEYVDGVPSFTEVITNNDQGMTVSLAMNVYTLWRCECLYDAYRLNSTFSVDQQEAPAIWATNSDSECTMPSVTLTASESSELSQIYSDIYTYAAENVIKFINGDKDMSEWDSFVETLNGMNVDAIVDIYQAAYDRYISR